MRLLAIMFFIAAQFTTQAVAKDAAADHGPDHEVWYPSKWGPDDELGAANLLTPELVTEAAKLIKTGKTYALGIPVNKKISDNSSYRRYQVRLMQLSNDGKPFGTNKATFIDDQVIAWQGLGTQLDGFGHAGINWTHYNGVKTSQFARINGATKFSNHKIPPIVTRGILLDVAAFMGVERLPASFAINKELLKKVEKAQGTHVRKGDVVLINTGWLDAVIEDKSLLTTQAGLGVEGARYLVSKGVVVIGADTTQVEVYPAEKKGQIVPVHQELLVKSGVYMLQMVRTSELAKDKAYEFFFTLGQPKLEGTVQTIVNPIAIR